MFHVYEHYAYSAKGIVVLPPKFLGTVDQGNSPGHFIVFCPCIFLVTTINDISSPHNSLFFETGEI